jgi:hypothetical protein
MIDGYVTKLMENLPIKLQRNKKPLRLDIILDGGAFNGSYLIGALYFLREMERRKHIIVEKISGASIGSLAGFMYCIDRLDMICDMYNICRDNLTSGYNLKCMTNMKEHLGTLPDNVCELVNHRLYITYNNIKKGTKPVKCLYKNSDDIINTIIKSCYLPLITDGQLVYETKYIDGMNPYIFKPNPNKKILYLSLIESDKIQGMFNIKNEKTNFHRIMTGLLDIHSFYIKESSTTMCSYVDKWTIQHKCKHWLRYIIEKILVYLIVIILFVKQNISVFFESSVIYKIVSRIAYDIVTILMETYCF